MIENLRVGVVQMNAGLDKAMNVAAAERLVRSAATQGAQLVLLPELFDAYGPLAEVVLQAEAIPGPTSERFSALARELGIYLAAGSICEHAADGKGFNTSLLFGPDGTTLAKYRKLHLFDIEIPGKVSSKESDSMLPGNEVAVAHLPWGVIGQAICYDLRFPELFRTLALQGMEVLLLASAFTATTGRDHWEVLVRARAIENQCYLLAANQYGAHGAAMRSHGESMIIDPWGRMLARAPLDAEAVLVADLSAQMLRETRARILALVHGKLPM
jgi:predicted amidohydrolase